MAAYDPPDGFPTEPAIAAGPDWVVSVFFNIGGAEFRARYGAYDPGTGDFLAAGLVTPDTIVTCRFREYNSGELVPLGWVERYEADPGYGVDKPWIVAGDPNFPCGEERHQEYYIVCWAGPYFGNNHYEYLRSVDGGYTWGGGEIKVGNTTILGPWCAQSAVYKDGPLYVAYPQRFPPRFQFLLGQDVNDPANRMQFEHLYADPYRAVPLNVPLNHHADWFNTDLPGNFNGARSPQLAVDPNNPDRLFIAYHDSPTDDPNDPSYSDINVYLNVLTRSGRAWTASERIEVNNDNTLYESDQFLPTVVVDKRDVHVIFYDDRRFNVDSDQEDGCADPKFDVYYAWAPVNDVDFSHQERNQILFLNENDPNDPAALDLGVWDPNEPTANPREYIGIAW